MEMKQKRKNFSKRIIRQAVEDIESGFSRTEVRQKYGMAYTTLNEWIKRYGSKEFLESRTSKITSHQKRLIITAIKEGKMTIDQANLAYKIKGGDTIRRWLREDKKAGDVDPKESALPVLNDVTSQELQRALHQANLKLLALETMIDVAEEQFKIKIRKKPGAKQ